MILMTISFAYIIIARIEIRIAITRLARTAIEIRVANVASRGFRAFGLGSRAAGLGFGDEGSGFN